MTGSCHIAETLFGRTGSICGKRWPEIWSLSSYEVKRGRVTCTACLAEYYRRNQEWDTVLAAMYAQDKLLLPLSKTSENWRDVYVNDELLGKIKFSANQWLSHPPGLGLTKAHETLFSAIEHLKQL